MTDEIIMQIKGLLHTSKNEIEKIIIDEQEPLMKRIAAGLIIHYYNRREYFYDLFIEKEQI